MARSIENILAGAAYDPEGLVAPKEFWFDEAELKAWYESRKELWKT